MRFWLPWFWPYVARGGTEMVLYNKGERTSIVLEGADALISDSTLVKQHRELRVILASIRTERPLHQQPRIGSSPRSQAPRVSLL